MDFTFLFGIIGIIISVIALITINAQSNRIERLEDNVTWLRSELKRIIDSKKEPSKSGIQEKEKQTPKAETIIEPAVRPVASTSPSSILANKPIVPNKSKTSAEWEALIGGKILNRIGALALIIGVGFFLKYAFDNNWISETVRVIIGFVLGAALLVGGYYYSKKNFIIFSQGLAGAGIAILYLSVYSSFNYYHLVPQPVAIVMMSAVTVITFWQAFRYNSIVIGLFGWLGGFLTPFLLSNGHANETGLFLYIAILDIGLLYIILKKEKWFLIEPLTLGATIIIYYAWYFNYYKTDALGVTTLFIIVFWLIFLTLELFRIFNKKREITLTHQFVSLTNGAFLFISLFGIIDSIYHKWMGLITIAISAIYFGIYLLINRKRKGEEYLLIRYLLSAVFLMVVASSIQFDGFNISIAWAIESLILAALAVRYKNNIAQLAALVILVFSALNFFFTKDALYIEPGMFRFIINNRALTLAVMLQSAIGSFVVSRRFQHKGSIQISAGLTYTWIGLLFLLITLETKDYFNQLAFNNSGTDLGAFYQDNLLYVPCIEWIVMAIPLLFFALKKKFDPFLHGSLFLVFIAVIFSSFSAISIYSPINSFYPVINIRSGAIVTISVCLFIGARWMDKIILYAWFPKAVNLMRIVIVIALFILLTVEIRDIFEKKISMISKAVNSNLVSDYNSQQQLCISAIWLFYSMLLMAIGIYRSRLNIRIMSIILFGITIAKVFFYDLSYLDTLHRIISFIGLGVILLLVSFLYQKFKYLILVEKSNQ